MKYLLLTALLLAFSVSGKDFLLKNGQSGEYRFDAPAGSHPVLFLRARIKLPAPHEAWGAHALELKLNGEPLAAPLNKTGTLLDPQTRPWTSVPVCGPDGRWFVKADSDWTVFNAPGHALYRNTYSLNQVNRTELNNVFYSFAFPLKNLAKKNNVLTLKAVLPENCGTFPVEIAGVEAVGCGDTVTFRRDWLQAVYPWSFPALEEIRSNPELVIARNSSGIAAFSIYCFAPSELKLPADVQVYRLDNTLIPAKIKQAGELQIPNIGKPYVPELLTPLKKGAAVKLMKGTTTFIVKYHGTESGKYEIPGLPVKVRVLDFALPDHEELPVENGIYVMAGGSDRQNIQPEMRQYGLTQTMMSPWAAPIPLKIADGKLTADFSRFDARLKKMQGMKLNRRRLLFGTSEPILSNIRKLTGEDVGGAEFNRRFKEFIELFFDHADQLKLKVWLSLYDEANFQKESWKKTQILTKIAVTVPNSRLWSTVTELSSAAYYFDTLGYRRGRDITVTHPFQTIGKKDDYVLPGVLVSSKTIKELRGRFHSEYDGVESYPGAKNRYVYGVRSRYSGLELMLGFAFWWGSMNKPNVTPTKCFYVSYPFFEKETGIRYSTVGWEAIREGIDDYRYFDLAARRLAARIGKDKAEARLRALIPLTSAGADRLPPEYFNRIREQLIRIIEENQ